MDKSSQKNLIEQPIFKQILNLIPRTVVDKVVLQHQSDRYYKSFSTWDELVTLLFGIFERCDSAREVCDGMPNLKCSLIYEVQIYKKTQLRSETRWRKRYCDSYEIICDSMSEGYAFSLMAMPLRGDEGGLIECTDKILSQRLGIIFRQLLHLYRLCRIFRCRFYRLNTNGY